MTYDQWVYEYESIRRREDHERKEKTELVKAVYNSSLKAFQESIIYLFGLNIGADAKKEEDQLSPFTPLILTCGNPHVVQKIIEQDRAKRSVVDPVHDKYMEDLMSLNLGDLAPLLNADPEPTPEQSQSDMDDLLRSIGVVITDGEDDKTDNS